jgi:imidazolonepropionase-like amidohydrolase
LSWQYRRIGLVSAAVATLACAGICRVAASPRLEVPQETSLVLDDVTLVRPGSPRQPHRRLEIRDRRITRIAPSTGGGPYTGKYVLAGLVDMHVHLPPGFTPGQRRLFLALELAHGVTSVREVGSLGGASFELKNEIRRGERAGPRLFACGQALDGRPPSWPIARVVESRQEGERAVAELAAEGADCIKVYDRISADALEGVRAAARAHRLPVVGHLPRALPAMQGLLDDVQHLCAERCNELRGEALDAFVRASAENRVAHTPTLVVFAGRLALYDYAERVRDPHFSVLPSVWREVLWHPELALGFTSPPAGHREALRRMKAEVLGSMLDLVGRLRKAGVRIHVGTDPIQPFVVPGASVHEEMRLLVEAGLATEEALAAATWVAGESLGVPGLGRLEEGAPADLLILREDPTRELSALDTLEAVIADGRFYPRDVLQRSVGEQRDSLERPLRRIPTLALARLVMRWLGRWSS